MYYTYILFCKSTKGKERLYVGSCSDLQQRFKDHRRGNVRTTKGFNSITLIYYEASLNKTDARKRELQLKTGFGRGYLKRRLENYLKNR